MKPHTFPQTASEPSRIEVKCYKLRPHTFLFSSFLDVNQGNNSRFTPVCVYGNNTEHVQNLAKKLLLHLQSREKAVKYILGV